MFRVVIDGTHEWQEDAGDRSLYEFQHRLAIITYPGSSVKVTEQYLGGAKTKTIEETDEELDD